MPNKTFFSKSDMFKVSKKVNPAEVLEFIKGASPVSVWIICKKLELNRNTAYYLIRDLEFAGLIYTKLKTNEHNRKVRIVYYNKRQLISDIQDEEMPTGERYKGIVKLWKLEKFSQPKK